MFTSQKALFRNGSQRLLGGVCSGLSVYFGVNKSLIRVAFLFSTLFFGIIIPLYIFAWALIPKARTISDKARMNGEPEVFQKEWNFKEPVNSSTEKAVNVQPFSKPVEMVLRTSSVLLGALILFFTLGLAIGSPLILELFWSIEFNTVNIYFNPIIGLFSEGEEFGVSALITILKVGLPGVILILKGVDLSNKQHANRFITVWILSVLISYFFL